VLDWDVRESVTSIAIPDSVRVITRGAFDYSSALTNVTIGNGVISMESAFSGSDNLTTVTFSQGIEIIPDDALSGCRGLTTVNIPSSVTRIGSDAFYECESLATFSFPENLTSIGARAFVRTGLSNIIFPPRLEVIENWAFADCLSLLSVVFPSSITKIGRGVFADCSQLQSVEFGAGLKVIEEEAFYRTALTNANFPHGLELLGPRSFAYTSLTEVSLPQTLRFVGSDVFFAVPLTNAVVPTAIAGAVPTMGFPASLATELLFGALGDDQGQIAAAEDRGRNEVLQNPGNFNLYSESSIMDMKLGTTMVRKSGDLAIFELQVQTSTNLATQPFTNYGSPVLNAIPMPGDKGFLRIRAAGKD
jgi:hypothetical protein